MTRTARWLSMISSCRGNLSVLPPRLRRLVSLDEFGDIPNQYCSVGAGRRDRPAVRCKGDGFDPTGVAIERANFIAAVNLPKMHNAVQASVYEPFSVRRKGDART